MRGEGRGVKARVRAWMRVMDEGFEGAKLRARALKVTHLTAHRAAQRGLVGEGREAQSARVKGRVLCHVGVELVVD